MLLTINEAPLHCECDAPVRLLYTLLHKASKHDTASLYGIDNSELAILTKTLKANVDNLRQLVDYSRRQSTTSSASVPDGSQSSRAWSLVGVEPSSTELYASDDSQLLVTVSYPDRYKTELCRQFEEHGTCRYAEKCRFAHGRAEIRLLARHPKYKTEMCRTFHTTGFCPYGHRCHFIHNDEERLRVHGSDRQPAPSCLQSNGTVPVSDDTIHRQRPSTVLFPVTSTPGVQFVEAGTGGRGRPILARSSHASDVSMTSPTLFSAGLHDYRLV